ncbi:hypothetical protein R5R35_012800 [Gryllus longicercus]|uniref:serine--tRNA ligase n=1 Tax=Gryllus longicercus TaxID=2509291 RepID=A0AAN9VRF6_9ORTH
MFRYSFHKTLLNVYRVFTPRKYLCSNLKFKSKKCEKVLYNALPKPELDIKYLCDAKNKEIIELNIKKRKGVGNINRVQELYHQFENAASQDKLALEEEFLKEALQLPNSSHPQLLSYADDPKIVNKINEKKVFTFKPKEFSTITKILKVLKTENLGNFAGHKSYYLLGGLAEMEQALIKLALQNLLQKGFKLVHVPDILPRHIIESCGMNTRGERTQVYELDSEKHIPDMILSGTSEMALAGYLMNKVYSSNDLPLKYMAVSRCYRAETSAVTEERGIYRVHQFTKVEMFGVTEPENSHTVLEEFRTIQEEFFASFGLHFVTLDMPLHELGAPAFRKYDIEAWLPGRGIYGEVSSCSNCTDYQSRRLNIKYSPSGSNKLLHVHTINGTACAIPRMLIALVETNQQSNGSVQIPEVLQPFMNGKTIITREENLPKFHLIRTKLK